MKAFLDALLSRATAAMVLVALACALVWTCGPWLSLGELRPLEGVPGRVAVMACLLLAALLTVLGATRLPALVLALALLIWTGGPLLAVGSVHPLQAAWARVAAIAALVLALAAVLAWRFLQALRRDPTLIERVWGRKPAQALAQDDIRAMQALGRRATGRLRQMRQQGGWWRALTTGRRHLYELPWYLLLGEANAGKTSLLRNAGLQFPVPPETAAASPSSGSHTPNCAWWFAHDAVLVDTAGRFTCHGEGSAADNNAAGWQGLLHVLRGLRPRAPVNGGLLAVDAARLAGADEQAVRALAAQLRTRLEEARATLGVRFPVYVLVSRADALQGFAEYFGSLTTDARAQVWGFTLPWEGHGRRRWWRRRAGNAAMADGNLAHSLQDGLSALAGRVSAGVAARLQEEFEPARRQRLYRLPHELRALAPRLSMLLQETFAASRFDPTAASGLLRGVYFSSAAQRMEGDGVAADGGAEAGSVMARLRASLWASAAMGPAPGPAASTSAASTAAPAAPATVGLAAARATDGAEPPIGTGATVPASNAGARGEPLVQRGYFLSDLFTRLVFLEAHLVRPNLRLEARLRLAGWLGHALVGLLLAWLLASMWASHRHNQGYLEGVASRTAALHQQLRHRLAAAAPPAHGPDLPDLLDAALALPQQPGLDLDRPPLAWRFGLYSGDLARQGAARVYEALQLHLLLPGVTARMEHRLAQAVQSHDTAAAYDTLRVYLMLFEPEHYAAADLRAWVLHDWQAADGLANSFGGRAVMLEHLQRLYAGQAPVRPRGVPNAALVQQVRAMLDAEVSATRLYERAKAQLAGQAPADFSLVAALGAQAGTLFARASGAPLEQGVPGLFTHAGYHRVWSPRLDALIAAAARDDAWVMGRRQVADEPPADAVAGQGRQGILATPGRLFDQALRSGAPHQDASADPAVHAVAMEVRRQYLQEYHRHWTAFLDDVRIVAGVNLAFDLQVLRQLAAPDSPLARLARAAARETTLAAPLPAARTVGSTDDGHAVPGVPTAVAEAPARLASPAQLAMERREVDNRFAALREVVTGQVDAQALAGAAAGGRTPALESLTGLVNDYYTALLVADAALTAGAVPAGVTEVGARLRLEAERLPAPLRAVLLDLGRAGAGRAAEGAQAVLRQQAQLQLDRINGLLTLQVTEPCRRLLEGRYPFAPDAPGTAEVGADDFQLLFATGGTFDDFFMKQLLPYADLSTRPWRYRTPESARLMAAAGGPAALQVPVAGAGAAAAPSASAIGEAAAAPSQTVVGAPAPTLAGELLRLLAERGPDLEVFRRASQIREAFFRDGGRRLGWKADVRVAELDPAITELALDFDGQGQRYAHGPVMPWVVTWPGPRGGASAELTAHPRIRADTSSIQVAGPWALQRLLERGRSVGTAVPGKVAVEFSFDGRRAVLDLSGSGSQGHPMVLSWLRGFQCPGGRAAS